MSKLKENLEKLMKAKNFNPNSLAKKAGLESSAVKNILQGKSLHPRINTVYSIADALSCSVDELYGRSSGGTIMAINDRDLWALTIGRVDSLIKQSHELIDSDLKANLYLAYYEFSKQGAKVEKPQFDTILSLLKYKNTQS